MKLPFREVHLDFHTSELIRNIGKNFDKNQFQKALKTGHVDSITVFAKCHHGMFYYPTKRFAEHPYLDRDLLGEMIEACREIGVRVPVYISAGWDEAVAREHPEWHAKDKYPWTPYMEPGFTNLCFNTGYLDLLVEQTREVVSSYDVDGLVFDVCVERICHCDKCLEDMDRLGIDVSKDEEVAVFARQVYKKYYTAINEAIHAIKPGLPVFHNCGHIQRGRRDLVASHTHLEIESLPTGGWGYDNFPLSVAYAHQFGKEILGITGKFHTHWGEFGGYKARNALIYESALIIANGAKCSIGDQLHPLGRMDEATYELIGEAYSRVEEREAWCDGATHIADVGVLSQEAMWDEYSHTGDIGANRILLEGKYLYRVLDRESDLDGLKVVIIPDAGELDGAMAEKLRAFVADGGKILASGVSGLLNGIFAFDFGARYLGKSDFEQTYIDFDFVSDFPKAVAVLYGQRHYVEAEESAILAWGYDPYFNRHKEHFCSHQHAPANYETRRPGITEGKDGIYIGWDIFGDYMKKGSIIAKKTVAVMLDRLLGGRKTVTTSLPAQGVVTFTEQKEHSRFVAHFLYASPVRRGEKFDIIEDINPLYDVAVTIRTEKEIKRVVLVPEHKELDFSKTASSVAFTIPKLWCHAVVVLEY
jgi:hypothetical protein